MNGTAIPVLSAFLILNWVDVLAPFVDGASREGRKGNERYAARDWEHAVEHYGKAASSRKDGALEYNLGTAAYQKKDYQTAVAALGRAAADAKIDRERVAYNAGNAHFRMGDLEGALGAYRSALCLNPNDADARANYELALRQLRSSPPDSSQQGSSQNSKNDASHRPSNANDSGKQGSSGAPDSSSAGQKPTPPQEPKGGQPSGADSSAARSEERGAPPPRPGEMTPAEANRLLNAVMPEERELLQARLKAARKHRAEKDW